MHGVWQVGTFIIQHEWIIILIAYIFAMIILHFTYNFQQIDKQERKDIHANALFLLIIVYQLAPFVYEINIAIRDPMALLSRPGTSLDWGLAWIGVVIYTWMKMKHDYTAFYTFMLYFFFLYVLTDFIYRMYEATMNTASFSSLIVMTIYLALFFLYLVLEKTMKPKGQFIIILLIYSVSMIVISYMSSFMTMLFIYVSMNWFILLLLFVLLMSGFHKLSRKKNHKSMMGS